MNIRTLCLGILSFGDATGYEIRKLSTQGEYSYFVEASFGAIYPALAKLYKEGLVSRRNETQGGKPARKVYSITAAGRQAFDASLRQAPAADVFRSEFLFLILCAEMMPPELIRQRLDERIDFITERITGLKTLYGGCQSPGARWTADYGIACYAAALAFIQRERHRIERIAGRARLIDQAAE